MDERKLWPVEQLLERLDSVNTKFLTVKPPQLWLLICLLRFAHNKTLTCFPSITRLSNISGLARSTVCQYLNLMENVGILIRKNRLTKKGNIDSTEYKINPNNLWKSGAYCPYPSPYLGLPQSVSRTTQSVVRTLTTNITTQLTKKQKQEDEMPEENDRSKYKQITTHGFVDRNTVSDEMKAWDNSQREPMPEELRKKFKRDDKLEKKVSENEHPRIRST